MPDGFTTPTGIKGKAPPIVPLTQTDTERQKMYQPLMEMNEAIKADPSMMLPVSAPAEAAAEAELAVKVEAVSEEDKRAFLASILGNKRYEKIYTIFGDTKVRLVDRSNDETEFIFAQLDSNDIKTDNDYYLNLERSQLAFQLREVHAPASGAISYEPLVLEGAKLKERVDLFLKLPKPLYQALMEVGRQFEAHVDLLTQRATDANFWKPGVQSSRSTPRAQARSTTPNTAVTAGTGR